MFLKTLLSKVLYLIPPVAIFSGGSYFSYQKFWPKTIEEWLGHEGVTWIKDSNSNHLEHYKSTFHDGKKDLAELKIDGLNERTSEDDAATKIKTWCSETLKKHWSKDLEKSFKKFCIYKPKSLIALIVGQGKGKELITDDEDYKTVFVLYGRENKYKGLINSTNSDNNDQGKQKLKTWCEGELNKLIDISKYNPQITSNAMTLCTKPDVKTVKEKIDKAESNWTIISGDDKWQDAFEGWKHTSSVINAINKTKKSGEEDLNKDSDKATAGPRMKSWCETGLTKKLSEEGVYEDEYKLIKSACKPLVN